MAGADGDEMDLDGVEDEDLQLALMMSMQQVSGRSGRASGRWDPPRERPLITPAAARRPPQEQPGEAPPQAAAGEARCSRAPASRPGPPPAARLEAARTPALAWPPRWPGPNLLHPYLHLLLHLLLAAAAAARIRTRRVCGR